MTLADRNQAALSALHPTLQDRAKKMIAALDILKISVLMTEGARSFERQNELYCIGRTVKSYVECKHQGVARVVGSCSEHPLGATVTKAKAGTSWHQYGVSFDAVPVDIGTQASVIPDWNPTHPNWKKMLLVGKSYQLAAGADWRTFPDYPHFQLKEIPASPTEEVMQIYANGGLPAVWAWADQLIGAPVTVKA